METIFNHTNVKLPEGAFKISPSMVYKFFCDPSSWYKSEVLKESTFNGNTATILGTICHYIYEQETNGNKVTREFITDQMKQYFTQNPDLVMDVDIPDVQETYPKVAAAVMNQYVLLKNNEVLVNHGEIDTEKSISYCLDKDSGIYVAGTADRIENKHILVDYKHVGKKPADEIPYNYKVQLMTYAYMLNKIGYNIDTIRLVYGVKPTKTLDARCFVVSENITSDDFDNIENILYLIVDTIKIMREHPEYTYILFKDSSLKEK